MPHSERGPQTIVPGFHSAGYLPSGAAPLSIGRLDTDRLHDVPWVALVQRSLNPVVIASVLLLCALGFEHYISVLYLSLAGFTAVLSLYVIRELPMAPVQSGLLVSYTKRRLLVQWLKLMAIVLFIGFATKTSTFYSRKVLLTWFAVTPVVLLIAHEIVGKILRRAMSAARSERSKVIVGANRIAYELARRISSDPLRGSVIGFFDDRDAGRISDVFSHRMLGSLEDLPEFVRTRKVDSIYIALPTLAQARITRLLQRLEDTTVSVYFVPDLNAFQPIQTYIDDIDGIPAIAIRETPFRGLNSLIKRVSDVAIALVAITLTWPVMLALALAVKLSSPGPVLFRQRRYGIDGHEITIYKFRTMRVCEDGDRIVQAKRNDARVTPVGRFMRAASLDELPQFFNVLGGSMSAVGPRPHAVAHNEQYRKLIPGYMLRHKVKPGITGWAQVNGLRGETEDLDKMKARVHYDLDYLRNWSVWLDIWVVLRTVMGGFSGRGAY